MGAFVKLLNYITYRLSAAPDHFSRTIVGVASAVYLTGTSVPIQWRAIGWEGERESRVVKPRR